MNDLVPEKSFPHTPFLAVLHTQLLPQASAGMLAGTVENGTLCALEVVAELVLGPSSMYSCTFSTALPCLGDCF